MFSGSGDRFLIAGINAVFFENLEAQFFLKYCFVKRTKGSCISLLFFIPLFVVAIFTSI